MSFLPDNQGMTSRLLSEVGAHWVGAHWLAVGRTPKDLSAPTGRCAAGAAPLHSGPRGWWWATESSEKPPAALVLGNAAPIPHVT